MEKNIRKLAPETIKSNLMRASLFLTAYELFVGELVESIRAFYARHFDRDGRGIESDQYKDDVLALVTAKAHPNAVRFKASCAWYLKDGLFNPEDVARIEAIKEHRNEIAHELPRILVDSNFALDQSLFDELRHYIAVLGRFWGRISIDTNEEFDGKIIADEDIVSGSMSLIAYISELSNAQSE